LKAIPRSAAKFMKIFAIYSPIYLVSKPDWLDEYRDKYDQHFDFHVTLKQPCYINASQMPDIKNKLSTFFDELKLADSEIQLVFEKLITDNSDPADGVIMIEAQNPAIFNLQKGIVLALSDYKQYLEPVSKEWEENFRPHLTIAYNLDSEKFGKAKKELPQDYVCRGVIREVELAIKEPKGADNTKADREVVVYRL